MFDRNTPFSPYNRTVIFGNQTEVYNNSINSGNLYNYIVNSSDVTQNFTIRVYDDLDLYSEWNFTIEKGVNTKPNILILLIFPS